MPVFGCFERDGIMEAAAIPYKNPLNVVLAFMKNIIQKIFLKKLGLLIRLR